MNSPMSRWGKNIACLSNQSDSLSPCWEVSWGIQEMCLCQHSTSIAPLALFYHPLIPPMQWRLYWCSCWVVHKVARLYTNYDTLMWGQKSSWETHCTWVDACKLLPVLLHGSVQERCRDVEGYSVPHLGPYWNISVTIKFGTHGGVRKMNKITLLMIFCLFTLCCHWIKERCSGSETKTETTTQMSTVLCRGFRRQNY